MRSKEAQTEWIAWQDLCKELNQVGIEINSNDALAHAMRYWSQKYYEFRLAQ